MYFSAIAALLVATTPVDLVEQALRAAAPPETPVRALGDVGALLYYTFTGNEPETNLGVDAQTHLWRPDLLLQPRDTRHYPSALVWAAADAEPLQGLLVRALIDSGELRTGDSLQPPLANDLTTQGRPVGEHFKSGAFVRELVLGVVRQGVSVDLGRRRASVGEGLVYDSYGTGVVLSLDGAVLQGAPWRVDASALAVGTRWQDLEHPSPLTTLRVEYAASLLERLGVFGSVFWDRNNALVDVVASSLAEAAVVRSDPDSLLAQALLQDTLDALGAGALQSRGRMAYVGIDGNVFPISGLSLRGAAVASWGTIDLTTPRRSVRIESRGWAAQLAATYGVGAQSGAGVVGFALSGDDAPTELFAGQGSARYDAFVGVAPYWVWTGLFFSGGLGQSYFAGRLTPAGVNGHGVLGGGPTFEYAGDSVRVDARAVWLQALSRAPSPPYAGGGNMYGVEGDLRVEWAATGWLTLAGELDALLLGSFFPEQTVAYRAFGLVSMQYAL